MMKRMVCCEMDEEGRNVVQSISEPMEEAEMELSEKDVGKCFIIDADENDPVFDDLSKFILYYNAETGSIETVRKETPPFDAETYLLEMDYRLSLLELGVSENDVPTV